MMTPEQVDDFVRGYFQAWTDIRSAPRANRVDAEHDPDGFTGQLDELLHDSVGAEDAWPIVLALIDRAPEAEALDFVAAGPLEDLIWFHGPQFGDRLVQQARSDSRFRQALRGVWGLEDLPEPLRSRLTGLAGPAT